jgi:hypothetical protein
MARLEANVISAGTFHGESADEVTAEFSKKFIYKTLKKYFETSRGLRSWLEKNGAEAAAENDEDMLSPDATVSPAEVKRNKDRRDELRRLERAMVIDLQRLHKRASQHLDAVAQRYADKMRAVESDKRTLAANEARHTDMRREATRHFADQVQALESALKANQTAKQVNLGLLGEVLRREQRRVRAWGALQRQSRVERTARRKWNALASETDSRLAERRGALDEMRQMGEEGLRLVESLRGAEASLLEFLLGHQETVLGEVDAFETILLRQHYHLCAETLQRETRGQQTLERVIAELDGEVPHGPAEAAQRKLKRARLEAQRRAVAKHIESIDDEDLAETCRKLAKPHPVHGHASKAKNADERLKQLLAERAEVDREIDKVRGELKRRAKEGREHDH